MLASQVSKMRHSVPGFPSAGRFHPFFFLEKKGGDMI